jgi:aminoglycoside phosphotransferase (APT) family kinase protein
VGFPRRTLPVDAVAREMRQVVELVGELTATLVDGGRSNLTYRLVDAAGHAWVLRRPPFGTVAQSANDVGREFRVVQALGASSVPVAGAVWLCSDEELIGAPFAVYDWVEGVVLSRPDQVSALSDAAQRRCTDLVIDQLLALHGVDPAAVGLGTLGRPDGYLARQVGRWQAQWSRVRTREMREADRLHDALAARLPPQTASGVVHGDYRLDNLMFAPDLGTVAAVIDWEMATLGDPLADLGLLLVYCDPVVAPVLPHGNPATAGRVMTRPPYLVERYARSSDRDLAHLTFYRALGAYKLAVIAEGIHRRFVEGETVGSHFETVGTAVPGLLALGLDTLADRA